MATKLKLLQGHMLLSSLVWFLSSLDSIASFIISNSTTLKLMQIMFEKGIVTRDDSAKTHIYRPAISRKITQKQFLTNNDH